MCSILVSFIIINCIFRANLYNAKFVSFTFTALFLIARGIFYLFLDANKQKHALFLHTTFGWLRRRKKIKIKTPHLPKAGYFSTKKTHRVAILMEGLVNEPNFLFGSLKNPFLWFFKWKNPLFEIFLLKNPIFWDFFHKKSPLFTCFA